MSVVRTPAEVFHPSEFIAEELKARGWSRARLAHRMGGDVGINLLALDLYCEVGPTEPNMRIGAEMAAQIGRAFGVSRIFFLNLENAWLAGQAPA